MEPKLEKERKYRIYVSGISEYQSFWERLKDVFRYKPHEFYFTIDVDPSRAILVYTENLHGLLEVTATMQEE